MDSILIIDDEPQIRKLLSRMMELEGYEVFQAADCQSTLKQLKLHNPQVVLCDVFLPDGNGVDMVTTIKKLYPELEVYNPQIEMFARFKMKSSFHKTKRII